MAGVVWLGLAGRGASAGDDVGDLSSEVFHAVRMGRCEVRFFRGIVLEMVKFHAVFAVGHDELPIAVGDGKAAICSVVDEGESLWFCGGIEKDGGEALAVLAGGVGEGRFGQPGKGGEEIDLADGSIPRAVGVLDAGGPADEERDAVAAFVDVAFSTAIGAAAEVLVFWDALLPGVLRAVVAREDDHSVFIEAGGFEVF